MYKKIDTAEDALKAARDAEREGLSGLYPMALQVLAKNYEDVMSEIHRLRSLEDSYDTEEEVLSELLLSLNKLCGT